MMRVPRIILAMAAGLCVLLCIGLVALYVLPSPYLRFMGRDIRYYSEVASACDLVLREHPVSSNDSVELYRGMFLPCTKRLSGRDVKLPKVIRSLRPDYLLVSSNRVYIWIPPERMGGFGVIWEQDEMRTNYWTLQSNGDGLQKTVYEAAR